MKKKLLTMMLAITFVLTGCNNSESTISEEVEAGQEEVENTDVVEEVVEVTEVVEEEHVLWYDTDTVEHVVTNEYIDLDNMHFYINDFKVTLGETTLQEIIDSGVMVQDDCLDILDMILEPDYYKKDLYLVVDDDYNLVVGTGNFWSDEDLSMVDCPITYMHYFEKLGPKTYDFVSENRIVTFDLPLNYTFLEVVDVIGSPTYFHRASSNSYTLGYWEYSEICNEQYGIAIYYDGDNIPDAVKMRLFL